MVLAGNSPRYPEAGLGPSCRISCHCRPCRSWSAVQPVQLVPPYCRSWSSVQPVQLAVPPYRCTAGTVNSHNSSPLHEAEQRPPGDRHSAGAAAATVPSPLHRGSPWPSKMAFASLPGLPRCSPRQPDFVLLAGLPTTQTKSTESLSGTGTAAAAVSAHLGGPVREEYVATLGPRSGT